MATNISFDDLMPSKQTSAPTKGADISFDDLISKPVSAPTTSASAPVEGSGGAAFGMYSKPGMQPMREGETSSLGAFGASALESVAATPGALLGARGAMAATPPVLPVVGPFAKPIAGIAGGITGGILSQMGINSLEDAIDKTFGTNIVSTREQQRRENPMASLAGQVVGGSVNPFMRPGLPSTIKEGMFGAGIMSGIGAGQRAIAGEDILDPKMMAIDVATGAFTKPTRLGERVLGVTPTTPTTKTPDLTKPLTDQEIKAADGFVLPVKQVAKEGDGAMSPWLMADGKIVGTGQDHIAFAGNVIDGPMPGGYSDFMNKTGAIRSAMFEDKTTGQYVVTLHMAEGQKPTKAQLESLTELEKERGKPIDIRIANKNGMVNPEYTPTTLDQLRRESIDPKTAGFVKKVSEEVAKDKAVVDAKTPVVEAAFRNKFTGEIERTGPKHTEDRKKEIGLMPIDKKTLEEAVAPWSDLPKEQQDLIRKYVELTHETSAAEKSSDPKTWTPEEKAAYERGDTAEFSRLRGYSKEDIAKYKEWQKTTGDVVKLLGEDEAFGIVYFLNKRYPYSHEAGFVDKNGTFLNRKEAWNRAKSAGQIPEGQALSSVKDGLRSDDLRIAGDERFKLADVPTEANGVPIKEGTTGRSRPDGRPIGAGFNKETRTITIDTPTLYEQYGEKPWTKPKVEGVYPIAKDAFPTFQDYVDFIVAHEAEHAVTPQVEGQTKAQYENQINQTALKQLAEKRAAAPKEPVATPETVPLEQKIDRTTTDPRNVKDEQEMFDIAKEIYATRGEAEAIKFYEGYRNYEKTWFEPIQEVEKFIGRNLRSKDADDRIIHSQRNEMLNDVPDPARREAIAVAVDKGDLSGLTPQETALAKKYEALVKDIGDRAVKQGVVKGLLEDYVTHILNWTGAPKGVREEFMAKLLGTSKSDPTMRGMDTTSKFAKERKFKTFEDLQVFIDEANARIAAAGKSEWRLNIKTKDIAEIYKEYALSMEKAIENKTLVDNLKQIRNVAGETLIKEVDRDNPMPPGWSMMGSPQFAGYAVHPDLKPALKFVFDAGPGDFMNAVGQLSQVVKRINVVGSFFHAKSLMEVLSSTGIPIYTPLKEAIVLPLVEKGVKAVTGKDIQLSAISKAVEQFKNGGLGDNVDTWIRQDGLKLEMPEDVSQGILTLTGKFADEMIGKFGPKTRALEKTLSTVEKYTLGYFDKYTWNYLHTGGKIMVADAYLEKARRQATEEGKIFDEPAVRKEIARFVNDSFGGLNWFDAATSANTELGKRMAMAAYSPEGRRALQVLLFAPDWTLSTIRAFTSALPKQLNPTKWQPVEGIKGMMSPTTKADYARLYQFKTALTYLTLINGINMITADRPVWENKDPTRVEYPDGTSMQAMKHAMEPYHWLADPVKTLFNKIGFLPKAAIIIGGGTEYASPTAPKLDPAIITGNDTVDASIARAQAIGSQALPFQVQAALDAPEGEGAKRALLGTMGLPVYGGTPEQKKAARKERQELRKEKAKRYREREKEAGR